MEQVKTKGKLFGDLSQTKKRAQFLLTIAIILMLISMIGASLIQTVGGRVTIKDIRFETSLGYRMSGLLFVPEGVSAENPAPAIVVSHGMFNNREMQDANFVELARRGYVVFSMDMFSHGNSENTGDVSGVLMGMYEAVKMLDTLNYVDSTKIGITGHSMGGMSSNMAVTLDNLAPRQLISAVLLNSADATYVDDNGNFANVYGNRDVGIIACQYDEFFMQDVDEQGNITPARDFLKYNNAQSFLNFGTLSAQKELRKADTIYNESIDGKDAIRVIYNPEIIHPWSHFSKRSTEATIQFFDRALGAPNPIAANNQIWQWKEFFNLLGLIGVAIFIVNFTTLMLYTSFFDSLRAKDIIVPTTLPKEGKVWFWGSLVAGAVFGTVTYFPVLQRAGAFSLASTVLPQTPPWGICLWAMLCGVFAIFCMTISYRVYGKKNNYNLAEHGIKLSLENIGKTVLLAIIVVIFTYGCVFFADYFFKTDFRIWVLAMKAFEKDKLLIALFPYALFFTVFYVANSVSVNSFNYYSIGKKKWVNMFILALFNTLPPLALLLVQYIPFKITGFLPINVNMTNMYTVWLFPLLVFLPVTAIIARKIYRVTNNPYLPGIINGLIVAIISCSNTLTWR